MAHSDHDRLLLDIHCFGYCLFGWHIFTDVGEWSLLAITSEAGIDITAMQVVDTNVYYLSNDTRSVIVASCEQQHELKDKQFGFSLRTRCCLSDHSPVCSPKSNFQDIPTMQFR